MVKLPEEDARVVQSTYSTLTTTAKQRTRSMARGSKTFNSIFRKGEANLRRFSPLTSPSGTATYQVIDFFSGCGGTSLGFAALGLATGEFEVVGGCDINSEAAKTFEKNLGAPCIVADVNDVSKSKATVRQLLKKFPAFDPDKKTVLIGCAPCQGFSSHRKKSWDQPDPRNSLPAQFARIARVIDPVCVVMENVPEMLSTKYWNEFKAAKEILESAGYIVKQSIYNAAEFGVAQERFRTVVIAMKREFLLPRPLIEDHSAFRTVRDAIGHLPPIAAGEKCSTDTLHYSASHKKSTIETIRAVPKDGGSRPRGIGPACLDRIKGFSDVYGRLYWSRPAITITHYARNPASGRFVHPEQDRGLTIRECAELQSFPRGFAFEGKSDGIYKQIGEAVPPLMSLAVATHVLMELANGEPSAHEIESGIQSITKPVSSSYSSVIAGIKMSRLKK